MPNTELMPETQGAVQAPVQGGRPDVKIPKPRKKHKWRNRLILLAVVVGVVAFGISRLINSSNQMLANAFLEETARYRDFDITVSGSATVEPLDSYRATALVKGEILEASFEEGDYIDADDLLFRIDAKDVENSIARAALSVDQARLSYNNLLTEQKNSKIKADEGGVIQTLHVEVGDVVTIGTPIADILDRDTMSLKVPFHAADAAGFYLGQMAVVTVDGTLETLTGIISKVAATDSVGLGGTLVRDVEIEVKNPGAISPTTTGTAQVGAVACAAPAPFNYAAQTTVVARTSGEIGALFVREGDRVAKDEVFASFSTDSISTSIENAAISLKNAQLALESAQNQLENYTITSPISGTVIEKNFKAGDNIDATTSGYLAVVYDMSVLTFDMRIDELDIGKIKVGQTVEITAGALEGHTFTGHVDKININGTTVGGVTSYPVTVVIDDPGELLPGMNVNAKIIVGTVKNALTIPVDAVARGNLVTIPGPGAYDQNGALSDISKLQTVEISLGRSNEDYIEVLSGLEEGDTVLIENQASTLMDLMIRSGMGGSGTVYTAP